MKIAALIGAVLAAGFVCAAPALAREQLGQRDPVTIDPQRGYIFFRSSQRSDVLLMREVTERERTAWQAERAEALTRAHARWERALTDWNRLSCDGNGRMTPQCQSIGGRPVEPTNENFTFAPPEMDNFVQVLGGRQFTRGEESNDYFIAVEPGSYVLYGPVVGAQNAMNLGTCLCMGSVRFGVRPGQITDIGELRYPRLEAVGPRGTDRMFGPNRLSVMAINPPTEAMPVPARLSGMPIVPAELRAADKMPNHFGVIIDRLPGVPGVLAYERDQVIDVRARDMAAPATQ
jgi:hypothetical protein